MSDPDSSTTADGPDAESATTIEGTILVGRELEAVEGHVVLEDGENPILRLHAHTIWFYVREKISSEAENFVRMPRYQRFEAAPGAWTVSRDPTAPRR